MKFLFKVQMCVAMGKTNASARRIRPEGWCRHAAWVWLFFAGGHANVALLHRDDAVRVVAGSERAARDDGQTDDNEKAYNHHSTHNHTPDNHNNTFDNHTFYNHNYTTNNHDSKNNHNSTSNHDNQAINPKTNLVETTANHAKHEYYLVDSADENHNN